MIAGIGIDLVRIARVTETIARHGDRARRRLFTSRELADCEGRPNVYDCLAARVAAKEAALKALGTGKGPGHQWTDIEVVRSDSGCPELRFTGRTSERAEELEVGRAWVSLSHEAGLACAIIVLERRDTV